MQILKDSTLPFTAEQSEVRVAAIAIASCMSLALHWSCPVSVDGLALGSQAVIHRLRAGRFSRNRARGPVGNPVLVRHLMTPLELDRRDATESRLTPDQLAPASDQLTLPLPPLT